MPVLIDGNNLLHAALDAQPERPPGRMALCHLLGEWLRRGFERRARVVFDGPAPVGERAQQIADPDVVVSFSGVGASADSVIIELIRTDSAPRRLLVVSTDHEIVRAARARRATSIRSDDFWQRLTGDLQRRDGHSGAAPSKPEAPSPAELEEWVKRFSEPKPPRK